MNRVGQPRKHRIWYGAAPIHTMACLPAGNGSFRGRGRGFADLDERALYAIVLGRFDCAARAPGSPDEPPPRARCLRGAEHVYDKAILDELGNTSTGGKGG